MSDGGKRIVEYGDEAIEVKTDDQRDILATRPRRRIDHRIRKIPTTRHKPEDT